jgi:hypothetical protein
MLTVFTPDKMIFTKTGSRFCLDYVYVKVSSLNFEKLYDFKNYKNITFLDTGCPKTVVFIKNTLYNQITSAPIITNLCSVKIVLADEVVISHGNYFIKHTQMEICFASESNPGHLDWR